MKKGLVIGLTVLIVLGLSMMSMATTEVSVDGTTTSGSAVVTVTGYSGSLDIHAYEFDGTRLSSSNEFHAWGSFDVTYKTEAIPGGYMTSYTGGILKTSIQAETNSSGGFSSLWYQDFDVTGYGTYEAAIWAFVEGDDKAEMNLANNGGERSLAVCAYPHQSYDVALHADGTSGTYTIKSQVMVGEDIFDKNPYNIGPDVEGESFIQVFGTGGDAWMSFGYSKNATDQGKMRHAGPGPAGAIGYCGPTVGCTGGTCVYVDAGSGTFTHYAYGASTLNFEGGSYPGGGTFVLSGTFNNGMHAYPWATNY